MSKIFQTEPFVVQQGVKPEHRLQAIEGYWRAFSRKLRYPLGPEAKAISFLQDVLDPDHAISAVSKDGQFLGMAGFKSSNGALIGGGLTDMARTYGWVGAAWRGALIHFLERKSDDHTLLMDGIFVEPAARGQGVGSALLRAIEDHSSEAGFRQVRLDVIDTNPRARALYERLGFEEQSTMTLGPLKSIFGFSSATEMTKPVGV